MDAGTRKKDANGVDGKRTRKRRKRETEGDGIGTRRCVGPARRRVRNDDITDALFVSFLTPSFFSSSD
jgi:hypothetical protein